MRSDRILKRYYNLINEKFFQGELPSNVCVRYATDDDEEEDKGCLNYYGWVELGEGRHEFQVVIVKAQNPGWTARISTLAHEMCHVATNQRDDHGPAFSYWHELLVDRGLFRKGAILNGVTLF
jgi:hypothetical protein